MSDVPAWLDALLEVVVGAVEAQAPSRVGLRFRQADAVWEVVVYLLPIELVGGAHDGEVVIPVFSVKLERLRSAFTRMDELTWEAHPEKDGPSIFLEGQFADRQVRLRILAFAPPDEQPATKIDVNRDAGS
jgi:hypothetical protein